MSEMTGELRSLAITAEEIAAVEYAGECLLRAHDVGPGLLLLALCLKWRSLGMPLPDTPETAGAEVVELHGWSRRVPCA